MIGFTSLEDYTSNCNIKEEKNKIQTSYISLIDEE